MTKQIRIFAAAALTLALQAGAIAQTTLLPATVAQDMQRLAPQLVTFAGSDVNFQNLVNGLSQGIPVTLTTVTADGFLQTVTFTPAGPMSSVDIARTLETARQQLIARGVANPTAQQIGVMLAGGTLPTASGTAQVSGLVTTVTPGGFQPLASTGASLRTPPAPLFGTTSPTSNLVVDIRPTAALPQSTTTGTTSATPAASPQPATGSPVVRFTSDSTRNSNTSDTMLPSSASQTPTINSSTGVRNGGPSPAEQLQRRR
jgi:hypothetical protein